MKRRDLGAAFKAHWMAPVAALGLFAGSCGRLIYGAPKGPDEMQGHAMVAGAFLIFLAYACAQIAWGALVLRFSRREITLWESFFWGSALFALLPGTLGFLPVIGFAQFPFWSLFLTLGPLLLLLFQLRSPISLSYSSLAYGEKFVFSHAIILGLGAVALAAIPHPFWDSLWYHLTASRFWVEAGRIHLPEAFPVAYKTGLWDYHFVWGQLLLGGKSGGGLIAAQLFGQWAGLLACAASFSLLAENRSLIGVSLGAILLGMVGSELFTVVVFAKNDWGVTFWSLCALAFFLKGDQSWLTGFAAGLAFSGKLTAAFFLILVLLAQAWRDLARPRQVVLAAAAFLLAATPLLLRNYVGTGNPFFPAMNSLFSSPMIGPTWRSISAFEGGTFASADIWLKLKALSGSPLVLCLVLFPPFHGTRARRPALWMGLGALVLFLFFSGKIAEWRLAGAALLVSALYGAANLENLVARAKQPLITVGFLGVVTAGAWLAGLSWIQLPKLFQDSAVSYRSGVGGGAMAWVRMNAPPGAVVATLQEQRIYWLFPLVPRRAFDVPALDAELYKAINGGEAVVALKKAGIRYLVLSAEFLDVYYRREVCDWLFELSEKYPSAVTYRSELSRVVDLEKIPER